MEKKQEKTMKRWEDTKDKVKPFELWYSGKEIPKRAERVINRKPQQNIKSGASEETVALSVALSI